MKHRILNILNVILGLFFFLGLLIIYGVSLANVFNIYIFGIGIFLIAVPAFSYWYQMNRYEIGTNRSKASFVKKIKQTGLRIELDLNSCVIKSNNWTSINHDYTGNRMHMLDSLGGDSEINVKKREHNSSNIICSWDFEGKKHKFEFQSDKDEITLKMLFANQRVGIVYVDKENFANYYADFEY